MNMFPLGWLFGGAITEWFSDEEALILSKGRELEPGWDALAITLNASRA
jgi:hypothetical protein